MLAALVAWMATTNGAQSTKPAKPETVLRWSFIGTEKLAEKKELGVGGVARCGGGEFGGARGKALYEGREHQRGGADRGGDQAADR